MALVAVAQAIDQIGTAQHRIAGRGRLCHRFGRREVHHPPDRQCPLAAVGPAQGMGPVGLVYRWQGLQKSQQCITVFARQLGEAGVGEGGIKQMPIARTPLVHGLPKIFGRPTPQSGVRVWGQVAGVDRAKWSGNALAAGVTGATRRSVAQGAIADARQVGATLYPFHGWYSGGSLRGDRRAMQFTQNQGGQQQGRSQQYGQKQPQQPARKRGQWPHIRKRFHTVAEPAHRARLQGVAWPAW